METAGSNAAIPVHCIQSLVMGNALTAITQAGRRNRDEGRIVLVQAIFDRP
jgi:hypothetical protein